MEDVKKVINTAEEEVERMSSEKRWALDKT